MASDYLGRTIATGDRVAVAGVVRRISSDEVVVVCGDDRGIHCNDADLILLDDLVGAIPVMVQASNLSTVSSLTVRQGINNFVQAGGSMGSLPFDAYLTHIFADVSHGHATDPGDWTFTVTKNNTSGTQIDTRALTCTLDNVGFGQHNPSSIVVATPMLVTAGTHVFGATFSGPSTDGILANFGLMFRRAS